MFLEVLSKLNDSMILQSCSQVTELHPLVRGFYICYFLNISYYVQLLVFLVKEVWITNAVEISDEVSQDDPIYPTTFKKRKPYGVENQERNRLVWQTSEAFLFALCKST